MVRAERSALPGRSQCTSQVWDIAAESSRECTTSVKECDEHVTCSFKLTNTYAKSTRSSNSVCLSFSSFGDAVTARFACLILRRSFCRSGTDAAAGQDQLHERQQGLEPVILTKESDTLVSQYHLALELAVLCFFELLLEQFEPSFCCCANIWSDVVLHVCINSERCADERSLINAYTS